MTKSLRLGAAGSLALSLVFTACAGTGGREATAEQPSQTATKPGGTASRGGMMGQSGMMGGMMGGRADTAAAPRTRAVNARATGCPEISQTLVDAGRKIFTGVGNCHACHGSNAQGTALAPNLTDSTWLNTDGSYAAIVTLVRSGVPQPKQFPAPMPPMGGAQLDSAQVCAAAAYVYSLSHQGD